jgi:cystathionine beta-lyase family protein involved in aluminum resistance
MASQFESHIYLIRDNKKVNAKSIMGMMTLGLNAGDSIEISADGPLRPPYTAYYQGGLTYESAKIGILAAADRFMAEKSKV